MEYSRNKGNGLTLVIKQMLLLTQPTALESLLATCVMVSLCTELVQMTYHILQNHIGDLLI